MSAHKDQSWLLRVHFPLRPPVYPQIIVFVFYCFVRETVPGHTALLSERRDFAGQDGALPAQRPLDLAPAPLRTAITAFWK